MVSYHISSIKLMVHFHNFVADKYLRTMELLSALLRSNWDLCNLVVCASNFRFKPTISLFQLTLFLAQKDKFIKTYEDVQDDHVNNHTFLITAKW